MIDSYLETLRVRTATLQNYVSQYKDLPNSQRKEKISHLIELTKNYTKQYFMSLDKKAVTTAVHDEIDRVNLSSDTTDLRCSRGCSYCCHWKVDTTLNEAAIIYEFVKENNLALDDEHFEFQVKSAHSEAFWQHAPAKKRACIFLSKSGICRVYKVRPASCRKVLVKSKPRYCKTGHSPKIEPIVILNTEVLTSLLWSTSKGSINLLAIQYKKVANSNK